MVVHPEVGKWLIGFGEKMFGFTPLGWRVVPAVVGTLLILVMIRFARRLTGSTLLGCVAGVLLAFDGLEFVLSRLALLDIFVAFFLLCAVHCLVLDRDWYRARMAALVPDPDRRPPGLGAGHGAAVPARGCSSRGSAGGWRSAASGRPSYPLAAFGAAGRRLVRGGASLVRGEPGRRSRRSSPTASRRSSTSWWSRFVVYVATWTGWLMHSSQYVEYLSRHPVHPLRLRRGQLREAHHLRQLQALARRTAQPVKHGLPGLVQGLDSLAHYHRDVLMFHTHFLDGCTHTYASQPRGWLLLNRPVGVDAQTGIKPGTEGCDAPKNSDCLRQVLLLGTPAVWWGGSLALLYAVVMWVGRRDWRFGIAVVGAASTWLPWFLYDGRPIFSFYSVDHAAVPRARAHPGHRPDPRDLARPTPRRTVGVVVAGSYVVLVMLNFAWFWPIYTDGLLTHAEWLQRIWFSRWI